MLCLMNRKIFLFLLISTLAASCSSLVVDSPEDENQREVFETLWQEFDNVYPYFDHKNVEWRSVYNVFDAQFDENGRVPRPLANILWEMLSQLEDGHVRLITPSRIFDHVVNEPGTPRNFSFPVVERLFTVSSILPTNEPLPFFFRIKKIQTSQNGPAVFEPIAYMHLGGFPSDQKERWTLAFDAVFESSEAFEGIIIDIRDNIGGNDAVALYLAGKFASEKVAFGNVQFRNGPENDDLTAPTPRYVAPTSEVPFAKPTIILTNRWTLSAAESFALAMRAAANATIIGDKTGGSSGGPVVKELPNGWLYSISTWIETDLQGQFIEDVGVRPDITVSTEDVLDSGQDLIVSTALRTLRDQLR